MEHITRDSFFDMIGAAKTVQVGDPVNQEITVLPMSGEGGAAVMAAIKEGGEVSAMPIAIAYCLATRDGKRMFTPSDIGAIAAKPLPVVSAIASAVFENCGFNDLQDIEEAEGN